MPSMSLLKFHPMKLASCMEEAPYPSDEQIYKTFSDLYKAIPGTSIVTLRQPREQVSTRSDMDRNDGGSVKSGTLPARLRNAKSPLRWRFPASGHICCA